MEHPVRQAGEDLPIRSQGGSVKVTHRGRGHPVLCRQRPVLCRQGAGGGPEEDHDGETVPAFCSGVSVAITTVNDTDWFVLDVASRPAEDPSRHQLAP